MLRPGAPGAAGRRRWRIWSAVTAVLAEKMHLHAGDQHGARMERLAACALHFVFVDGLQPADLAVLVGDQVASRNWPQARSSIAGGVGEMLGELRSIDIGFFGTQPRITGAAIAVFPAVYALTSAAATRAALTPPEPPPMTKRS
jgi:hypothetical protein